MKIEEILAQRVPATKTCPRTSIYGVGISDVEFRTCWETGNGQVFDPSYSTWHEMLKRSYSEKYKSKNPSYAECEVAECWHSLSVFDTWFLEHYVEGYQLDKDILFPGNKIYSPDTCIFVPKWLNSFVTCSDASRGNLPLGVNKRPKDNKLVARCGNPKTGKREYLGCFDSPDVAFKTWQNKKLEHVENMKSELDSIDARLYEAVKRKVLSLK